MEQQNAALAELQKKQRLLKEEVDDEDIAEVVAKWTGIPVTRLLEGEVQKLLHMEERLQQRVIGQDEAIEAVSQRGPPRPPGLQDPNRPIGSFIFLGPTGVGKTETAKALAEFLFDDENAMIRIDMTEYMEKHAVARLIGAPPGYVGYEEGGQLTEAVRRRPYSVVLFDEIEKAHPDVFNVLLQILDDGRLTDGQGRTVDFKNTVVIMTSNIGSQLMHWAWRARTRTRRGDPESGAGGAAPALPARVPEPGGRDRHLRAALPEDDIGAIVDIQLARLRKLLAEQAAHAGADADAAKAFLGDAGYDPVYGARPLKRAIQKYLQDPLALKVLAGEFIAGRHHPGRRGQGRAALLQDRPGLTARQQRSLPGGPPTRQAEPRSGRAGPLGVSNACPTQLRSGLSGNWRGQAWQETTGCCRWRCSDAPARLDPPPLPP